MDDLQPIKKTFWLQFWWASVTDAKLMKKQRCISSTIVQSRNSYISLFQTGFCCKINVNANMNYIDLLVNNAKLNEVRSLMLISIFMLRKERSNRLLKECDKTFDELAELVIKQWISTSRRRIMTQRVSILVLVFWFLIWFWLFSSCVFNFFSFFQFDSSPCKSTLGLYLKTIVKL